jgi:CubicO group peptidase (beta-lactamase class C family)
VKRFVRVEAIFVLLLVNAFPLWGQGARVLEYGSPSSADMDGNRLDQAIRLYRDAVERDDLRGVVLMVARHGKIVLHEAIGWRHRGYQLPMEKDTLFRMASNTKPVIASATLILVQEGKLALDDRVSRYFESFNNAKSRRITVQQLLSHTSGFRIRPIFLPFDDKTDPHPTLRSAVDKFGREGPEVEPGNSYSYSNAGFNTVGAVIEHVSAMSLEEFLTRRIYEPLGMVDTSNHEDPAKLHRMATVYRGSRGHDGKVEFRQGFTPDDPPDFRIVRASGGMISTAMDYAKFLQMYLNGGRYGKAEILTRESVRKATSPLAKSSESAHYGLGWLVGKDAGFSHGGSDGTMAWVDPSLDLFGLVFTQSPGGNNPVNSFQKLVSEACLTQ